MSLRSIKIAKTTLELLSMLAMAEIVETGSGFDKSSPLDLSRVPLLFLRKSHFQTGYINVDKKQSLLTL